MKKIWLWHSSVNLLKPTDKYTEWVKFYDVKLYPNKAAYLIKNNMFTEINEQGEKLLKRTS